MKAKLSFSSKRWYHNFPTNGVKTPSLAQLWVNHITMYHQSYQCFQRLETVCTVGFPRNTELREKETQKNDLCALGDKQVVQNLWTGQQARHSSGVDVMVSRQNFALLQETWFYFTDFQLIIGGTISMLSRLHLPLLRSLIAIVIHANHIYKRLHRHLH